MIIMETDTLGRDPYRESTAQAWVAVSAAFETLRLKR